MAGTGSETQHAPNRWWEGPSGRASQEGRYTELLTGGRGRSRPERSLSVGVDTTEESSWWRANLWWIVSSAIAVVILIVLLILALAL